MISASRFRIALVMMGLPMFAASVPGINNFEQLDAHVYRGAQPNDQGFQYLAKLGVKTVIDLRESGSRSKAEDQTVTRDGMTYVNIPMSGLTPPTTAEITKILSLLEDTNSGPVFVHCWRGADRTGAVIAAYHIDHDQWENARALQDARAHKMSFFQVPRQDYIRSFRPRIVEAKSTSPVVTAPASAEPAAAIAATAN